MNSEKIIIVLLSILIVLGIANLAVLIAAPSMYSESPETVQTLNQNTVPVNTATPAPTKTSNILDSTKDDLRGAYSYTTPIPLGTLYTSSIYSFEIVFPENWGALHEELQTDLVQRATGFENILRISSVSDPKRYIDIFIVQAKYANDPNILDLPAVKVGAIANRYDYYISSIPYGMPGVDSVEDKIRSEEVSIIHSSFKTPFNP